ncbi:MAG: ATP-binding protein [Gammaproteobacteria bacterium]|nr:ATP-binding protein [Gammaproteobacteria bacterium]
MLIEFSATNYRSIREKQALSLVAAPSPDLKEQNTFDSGVRAVPRLLRSVVMFGPNAGGKSNIVQAMDFMRDFVLTSASGTQEGERIPVTPYRLDELSRQAPSEFEVLFVEDGIRYQYGFSVSQERIEHEWLLAYPTGKAQRWFERAFNPDTKEDEWYFGPSLKGRTQVIKDATRVNALFLSTAVQLNNEQLRPVFHWFNDRLAVIRSHGRFPSSFRNFTVEQCKEEASRKRIMEFLQEADLGIDDLKLETHILKEDDLPDGLPSGLKEQAQKMIGKELVRPLFLHETNHAGEMEEFVLEDESDGTQNIFALAGPWLDVLQQGMVLVIDELDTSLHPKMVRFLVGLLHNSKTNQNNAQLVGTSHDVTLMEGDLFRRDQIWFVEKDPSRATRLVPLSDFSPRKGEAIMKGYLRGRYGALPYIPRLAS